MSFSNPSKTEKVIGYSISAIGFAFAIFLFITADKKEKSHSKSETYTQDSVRSDNSNVSSTRIEQLREKTKPIGTTPRGKIINGRDFVNYYIYLPEEITHEECIEYSKQMLSYLGTDGTIDYYDNDQLGNLYAMENLEGSDYVKKADHLVWTYDSQSNTAFKYPLVDNIFYKEQGGIKTKQANH